MKQDTLEGKAKTKNGVKRLCFSIICILLEVIFIITIVTRLNEYAEVINLFTRILSGILVLGLYASNKTSSMKMNCTPFVRQYGILFRKWGVFVCQRDNESTTERRR